MSSDILKDAFNRVLSYYYYSYSYFMLIKNQNVTKIGIIKFKWYNNKHHEPISNFLFPIFNFILLRIFYSWIIKLKIFLYKMYFFFK